MVLPLFGATKDRKLWEQINKEMYELYMHEVDVFKPGSPVLFGPGRRVAD